MSNRLEINTYKLIRTTDNRQCYAIHAKDNFEQLLIQDLDEKDVECVKNIFKQIFLNSFNWDVIGQIEENGCMINDIWCDPDELQPTIQEILIEDTINKKE